MFSVIIPLYNKEKSIGGTINSVLKQTYSTYELIIVNDGSTDDSLNIAKSYRDPRIKIITQRNGGESSARNTGIKAAINDYIALIDADDQWDEGFLCHMEKLIKDFPEASFFGCQIESVNGSKKSIINAMHSKRGYIENYFTSQINGPVVWSSSVIIKRECFNEVGYFNTSYSRGGDLDMWVRLARKYKVAFEPIPLSRYILDSENRACLSYPPLHKFYLTRDFNDMSIYEKKYHFMRIKGLLFELCRHLKIIKVLQIMIIYKNLLIKILFN